MTNTTTAPAAAIAAAHRRAYRLSGGVKTYAQHAATCEACAAAVNPNPGIRKGVEVTVNNHPAYEGEVIDRRGLMVTVQMIDGDVIILGHHEVDAR